MAEALTKALADEICGSYKSVGEYEFVVKGSGTTRQTTAIFSEEDWPLTLHVHYAPIPNTFSIALAFDNQHIRRLDSDEHARIQPHIHYYTSDRDPNLQSDVRDVPGSFEDPTNFEKTLRDFFRLFGIRYNGRISVVEAQSFEF